MRYETTYDELLARLPEKAAEIEKRMAAEDVEPDEGMHIIFGEVVVPRGVPGYDFEVASAYDAANLVAQGVADACVGTQQMARLVKGLSFVPLQKVSTDITVVKTGKTRDFLRNLKEITASERFCELFQKAYTCDVSNMGSIVYEC